MFVVCLLLLLLIVSTVAVVAAGSWLALERDLKWRFPYAKSTSEVLESMDIVIENSARWERVFGRTQSSAQQQSDGCSECSG